MYAILAASAVISSKTITRINYHVAKHADVASNVEIFTNDRLNLSLVVFSCVTSEIGIDHMFYATLHRITRVLGRQCCNPFTVDMGIDVPTLMYVEVQERFFQYALDRYNKQFNGNYVPHHLVHSA